MKSSVKSLFLFLSTGLLLGGCSYLHQHFATGEHGELIPMEMDNECMQIDFYQMGYNDGRLGKAQKNLDNYEDKNGCKVPVNYRAYHAGWSKGMKKYCTPTYMMGMLNGRTGHKLDNIDGRAQICQVNGYSLDTSSYVKGESRGAKQYCTVERGWHIGSKGQAYPQNACPTGSDTEFRSGWESGNRQYCGNIHLAKHLGKQGKPIPSVCASSVLFKHAHDKGIAEYLKKAK